MFDSMNPIYRNPVGAVPAGQSIHFKINPPRSLHCSAARLEIFCDRTEKQETLGMFWCGMDGETREWWECDYSVPDTGLYFYHFSLDTNQGNLCLYRAKNGGGKSECALTGTPWQITSYSPDLKTPDWLAGGVLYQIFSDRFYRSQTAKSHFPSDRTLHETWSEEPEWQPDAQGEITNSDYFGGDLKGIEEKLPYLASLGVTCLYLNPVFEAHSNHRYNTADYEKIDPMLGTEEDFSSLCRAAATYGIRILLDGVFSHTGSDSVYFNREGRYDSIGAFQSPDSPFAQWYDFTRWPDVYQCWWGIKTLPNVRETCPSFNAFINGPGGIIQKWLLLGAAGWRLDVADELPDEFLDALYASAKSVKPDAVILGEVWEDASNKTAYGKRRRYLLGSQLDSVMNYPFRSAVLNFLTGGDAKTAMNTILSIIENYPPQILRLLMNHIGTHDTERALTVLGGPPLNGRDRQWQSETRLTPQERNRARTLLLSAAALQYTLPGVPCLYYGDEAGSEGYRDPFNRRPFPWENTDPILTDWYRRLGRIRSTCSCLKSGTFHPLAAQDGVLAYIRKDSRDALLTAVNRGNTPFSLSLPTDWLSAPILCSSAAELPPDHLLATELTLPAESCVILSQKKTL